MTTPPIDRLPIPDSIKWLEYRKDILVVVSVNLPQQLDGFDEDFETPWSELDNDTQRFLAAVVRMEFMEMAHRAKDHDAEIWFDSLTGADAWRKAVE